MVALTPRLTEVLEELTSVLMADPDLDDQDRWMLFSHCEYRMKAGLHRWYGICRRCFDPACGEYARYGGRGISMWEPWQGDPDEFVLFCLFELGEFERLDGNRLAMYRIDKDGDFSPGNVRFATSGERGRNGTGVLRPVVVRTLWPIEWRTLGSALGEAQAKYRDGLKGTSQRWTR